MTMDPTTTMLLFDQLEPLSGEDQAELITAKQWSIPLPVGNETRFLSSVNFRRGYKMLSAWTESTVAST